MNVLLKPYFLLSLLVLGCALGKPEPPKITQDREACNRCRMLISDLRYAGAYYDGTNTRTFDDLGCMFSTIVSSSREPEDAWVMDYQKYSWLDARSAIFISAPKLGTPMNYGVVAVARPEAAEQLAKSTDGKVIGKWSAILTFFRQTSMK